MFQIDSRKINRHPNLASVREWYETTKPWRGREDRPFGGRKQQWCVLRKDGEDYVVSAWKEEVLRYRPDGYITVTLPRNASRGVHDVIARAIPWVSPWGCGTTWLMVNPLVVQHYPHYSGVYAAGAYDEPRSLPVVVAVHEERRTVSLRAFTPGDPLFAMATLCENPERDLVSVPMIHANRAVRKAAYKEYDLTGFAQWSRAYLQLNAPTPLSKYNYYSRWATRNQMPEPYTWLDLLRERDAWPQLIGDVQTYYPPALRANSTVAMLRDKILTELGTSGVETTHYQSLPMNLAYTAYNQRRRTIRQLGYRTTIDTIPYADARPQPAVVVAMATNTTPERIDG